MRAICHTEADVPVGFVYICTDRAIRRLALPAPVGVEPVTERTKMQEAACLKSVVSPFPGNRKGRAWVCGYIVSYS